ncbi:phosphatidylinositol 4-phosphate 5-kinase 2-like isoform X1 [Asparagus officinalis]|uniref:phosphatidylinositol 4-phosphate 5-kinase 2-like isoform X1 n=1 Tax=Asparagus officinalis TaxID=4686 RepID=UPI00098E3A48|nr:phosphatidylinositol 4-phosphate 5-kinase 2-like isoform X1 [Asparagus officinalis]
MVSAAKRSSSAEKGGFPKICIWESDGEAGDITCDIIDTLEVYRDGKLLNLGRVKGVWGERRRSPCCFRGGEVKKPGQMISKGHKNYDLMLNLQLGIRYSVRKPASTQMRELRAEDFDPREKYWTRFPPKGPKITPPHQSAEFRWKDYCPMVFRFPKKIGGNLPGVYYIRDVESDILQAVCAGICAYNHAFVTLLG